LINPIAVAIPFFFVLIGIELAVGAARGRLRGDRPLYRWVDAITDLGCGVLSQATGLFLTFTVAAAVYAWAASVAPWAIPDSLPVFLGTFIAVDFLYYWWHRASHRVNILWAAHEVHHQSEDYNLAVALRQSVVTALTSVPFYTPLVLIGVSPATVGLCLALNTLYQFWIHTRLVPWLGPLEWVLNTPSHHRVHHGINPSCIDRNHAGVFIVWDRLFGTYTREPAVEPVYGVVAGFRSANPLWANVAPYLSLARRSAAIGGLDGLLLWVRPPEWTPAGAHPVPEPAASLRWQVEASTAEKGWTGLWFVTAGVALTTALFLLGRAEPIQLGSSSVSPGVAMAALGVYAGWTVTSYGLWFDGMRRLYIASELLRVGLVLVGIGWLAAG
jgi:sterol desaturase/sphingolipid hydroxylase (fatty acid hydroxylase superfamily)